MKPWNQNYRAAGSACLSHTQALDICYLIVKVHEQGEEITDTGGKR